MRKPTLTNAVLEALALALVHADSVVDPDQDTHGEDVAPLARARRWVDGMREYRAAKARGEREGM